MLSNSGSLNEGRPQTEPALFAFTKNERLLREAEYSAVLKRGKAIRRPPLRILYLKKDVGPPRLGLWISKKDFKRAVDRNRLKRAAREWFRKNKRLFLFPCDLILQIGGRTVKDKTMLLNETRDLAPRLDEALRSSEIIKP